MSTVEFHSQVSVSEDVGEKEKYKISWAEMSV